MASQAYLYYVDKLSTAHFGVDRLWIKLLRMGITCNERGGVIPIIWGMWISYPHPMGITFYGYPLLLKDVENLSPLFVDKYLSLKVVWIVWKTHPLSLWKTFAA